MKPAYATPDPALENEWSDVLPSSSSATPAAGTHLPSATTRTSGLRPALPQPPPPSQRLPPPSRLPEIHPADGDGRTIQRNVSFAQLDFEDADRTQELNPDQLGRLAAAAALPSDAPPALPQRPTLPVPASHTPLPPQAFSSLSDLANRASDPWHMGADHQAAQALNMGRAMVGAFEAQLRVPNRPMPWVATPPLPRDDHQRLINVLLVVGAFVITAAIALSAALWVLHR